MATSGNLKKEVERILQKYSIKLTEFMEGNLVTTAGNLHAKGLVGRDTVDRMRTIGVGRSDLALELLAVCRPSLVHYPGKKFPVFIAALKECVTMVPLAEEMEDDFKTASMSQYISTCPKRLGA